MRRSLLFGALAALCLAAAPERAVACVAPDCVKLIDNGPDAGKKVVVVMGDGYRAGADQDAYNDQVREMLVENFFGTGFFAEQNNAFNVYRLNLVSAEEGVGRIAFPMGMPPVITPRNTALLYLFSGIWARCWLQHSMDPMTGADLTEQAKNAALAANRLGHADYVFVLLNEAGFGGCNSGPRDIVQTRGAGWETLAHEAGHGIGGLMDEYHNQDMAWSGGAVTTRNCSTVNARGTVLWNRYVDPATAMPTTFTMGMDANRTVGAFEGCATVQRGIWRPVEDCRMKGNTPEFCPVCQNLVRNALHPLVRHDFTRSYTGDFNGDGRDDVLVQNDDDLALYLASGSPNRLDRVWTANNRVPHSASYVVDWDMTPGDQFVVADFDGDGMDDLFVLNTRNWTLKQLGMLRSTGRGFEQVRWQFTSIDYTWTIGYYDQLLPGDFDGDGKTDLILFTAASWPNVSLAFFRSTGRALSFVKGHYASVPGGWTIQKDDRHLVGDFDGDGKDDLYAWRSTGALGMLRSTGTALSAAAVYGGSLPSGWRIGFADQTLVADFDGDSKDDLYLFNGTTPARLHMERSTGTSLALAGAHDADPGSPAPAIPGWNLANGDRFFVSDADKDGKADLFAFNTLNWGTELLGSLVSSGTSLTGTSSRDWVNGVPGAGGWNLGAADQILPANYEGGAGKADLYIRNKNWFGLIRREAGGFVMDRHYFQWIHSPLYDARPWQAGMP